jgi:polysaccharide deacetylase 2 family uncharacterized protein YibQ
MAVPHRTRKKAFSAKKTRKIQGISSHMKRGLTGLVFLIFLVLVLGFLVNQALNKNKHGKVAGLLSAIPEVQRHPIYPPAEIKPPTFEIYSKIEPPVREVPTKLIPSHPRKLPRIAIIIDDIGYDPQIAKKFADLNMAITLSILPHSPYQRQIIKMAREKGLDLMLHLPMEPLEYPAVNPGPGALMTTMLPDALIRQLNDDLDAVPYIKGVNNHMGSKMTASSDQMNQIFSSLKKKDLFFIDSRTTAESQARSSARLFQVPYAERDVFLDNVQDPEAIRKQFRLLLQKASINGQALAIGHPHALTLQILQEELPEIQKKVTIVPASAMVHPAG